jgi:hypothetical protein
VKSADGAKITGAGLPGRIWQNFMNTYLSSRVVHPFPPYEAS